MNDRFIYGLSGIMQLFNCSRSTAQKLKKGVIAPACTQAGRIIVVDWEEALRLVKESKETVKK